MKIASTNPAEGHIVIGKVEASTQSDVDRAIQTARTALIHWKKLAVSERCAKVATFLQISETRLEEIATRISLETGRPITSARGNVRGGLEYLQAYLDMAEVHLAPRGTFTTDTEKHYVIPEPYGVVGAICPWNYPYMNVVWQCSQALIAGNTIVYKNSEENPLFAQLLADLISASDLPEGVFNVLYGDGSVGERLARADIDLLSFTGSSATGRKLAVIAGEKFIPFVAELGGSNPLIVCEDTVIDERLAQYIADRRFKNAGQACDAVKRLIVHESNLGALLPLLQQAVAKLKVGDPFSETTDVGPLVAERQVKTIESQVADAVKSGATALCGGKRAQNLPGSYYEPTLLTNITRNMCVWKDETFGPVLPIVTFKTLEQAVKLANDTPYGLGAHIFTNDKQTFEYFVETIEAASIAQNYVGYWDPRNPFGGYKQSGRGRTHGEFGFAEVTQLKLVSREKL